MKTYLIIGGSHGIGFDLVQRLRNRGAKVVTACRTAGLLESQGLLEDDRVTHKTFDVTESDLDTEGLPEQLDGFVYCPGSIQLGALQSVKWDRLRADFELNTIGAGKCFQAILPRLQAADHASAVFFSTVAVDHGIAMHSYIAAAKGALQAMVRTWAAELAPKVRVNCVAPALTDTPLSEKLLSSDQRRKAMAEKYPLGRVGHPSDIAAAAEFLLSDQSPWMTGQVLRVDGGMSSTVRL